MYFMVLNDGETYTALDGCKILDVDEDMVNIYSYRDIDFGIKDFCTGESMSGITLVTEFKSHDQ